MLLYFRPRRVLDPMTGSGTCSDVCKELKLFCKSGDIRLGFDALDPRNYEAVEPFDFIWLHPPYWRMKKYGDDPHCLSNAPTIREFYLELRQLIRNCKTALTEGGKLAILMGDYHDVRLGKFIPCVHMTKEAALAEKLWPACTDIIRFQHGNTSSKKSYPSAFIPGLHDVCMVFERLR